MLITKIKLKKYLGRSYNIKAIADIELDECLVIHNINVCKKHNSENYYIQFPKTKTHRTELTSDEMKSVRVLSDIVHPITSDFRKYVEEQIIKLYKEEK